jgi:acylphosphatase
MIAREIIVKGKVQGVFYRASAREKADELGLFGWVRNRADGAVEIWVEGEDRMVQEMAEWCRQGPPRAMVEGIEIKVVELAGYMDFKVIRT